MIECDIHISVDHYRIRSDDLGKKLFPTEDPARVRSQKMQHFELGAGHRHRFSVDGHFMAGVVDHKTIVGDPVSFCDGFLQGSLAQDRFDP